MLRWCAEVVDIALCELRQLDEVKLQVSRENIPMLTLSQKVRAVQVLSLGKADVIKQADAYAGRDLIVLLSLAKLPGMELREIEGGALLKGPLAGDLHLDVVCPTSLVAGPYVENDVLVVEVVSIKPGTY